jgi:hypothetical protein
VCEAGCHRQPVPLSVINQTSIHGPWSLAFLYMKTFLEVGAGALGWAAQGCWGEAGQGEAGAVFGQAGWAIQRLFITARCRARSQCHCFWCATS